MQGPSDVSRETRGSRSGEAAATVAQESIRRQVFGSRYDLAVSYEEMLRTHGVRRGLVGPRESGRMWERHLLNCAVLAPAVPTGAQVLDVGSGAGLPGLVLAIARPDLSVCLVEPLLRRATFLQEAVDHLGLRGVEVRRERAEALHGRCAAPVVTARAVAPLQQLARWCLPLVEPGGALLALKGARAREELNLAEAALPGLGAESWTVVAMGAGVVDPPLRVVRIVRSGRDVPQPPPSRRARDRPRG